MALGHFLTDEAKKEILSYKGEHSLRQVSELFGISKGTVCYIWYPERTKATMRKYYQNKKKSNDRHKI